MQVASRATPPGAPGDVYVVELRGLDGRHGYAAWRSDDGQGPWAWKLPAGTKGTAYAIDGKPMGPLGSEVGVTRDPIYLIDAAP